MKKIISIVAAAAALVLVASCNSKPSEDVVTAAAVENATALVNALAANDTDAIKAAAVANATAPQTLGIEKYADLVDLYNNTYENTLEENMTTKDEVDTVIKSRGIELPAVSDEAADALKAGAEKEAEDALAEGEAAAEDAADAVADAVKDAEAAAEEAAAAAVEDAQKLAAEAAGEAVEVLDDVDIDVPFIVVETKPQFQGGNANAFSKWVNSNITYPENAKNNNIQGKVMLSFRVNKEGAVENVKVIKGVDPELDAEAVRVVSSSPAWTPGLQGGNPVNVTYNFPVIYKLQ